MANTSSWNQSKFDASIRELLSRHEASTWPKLLNKRMFFVTLRAFQNTPSVSPGYITRTLDQQKLATRKDGTMAAVKLGDIMVAKRASKTFTTSARFQSQARKELAKEMGGRGKGANYRDAWLKYLKEKNRSLRGGRAASIGFLRAGFVSILYMLGPLVGLARPGRGADTKMRGQVKGSVLHLASSSNLRITIENRAHSKTEHLGGFERIGGRSLQEAFINEGAELQRHLKEDMAPVEREFNRKQH